MSTLGGRRRVVLLGATGSIGRQAQDIIQRYPDRFELVGAVVGHDVQGLASVLQRFGAGRGAVVSPPDGVALPPGCGAGLAAACEVAAMDADVVCVGITGAAALHPTLAAIDAGREVAIATKEVLVMAGELVRARAAASGASITPVVSEHSALWQCLRGERPESVARLWLTASGGPFLELPLEEFASITPEQALRHPNWVMGQKVTIDSATMMNKGLEIIEAHFLFDIPYARIDVVIHPPSLVHSCVEFVDGAVIAQLGVPDMRVPIALAIADGERLPGIAPQVQLTGGAALEFFEVDDARFPAVRLARSAGLAGGVAPAVLNAANEVAVAAFLDRRLRFDEIVTLVAETLAAAPTVTAPSMADILDADGWARTRATGQLSGAVTAPA